MIKINGWVENLLLLSILLFISGCQTTRVSPTQQKAHGPEGPDEQAREIFNVMHSKDLKQCCSKRIKNGWMYSFTKDGLPENDPRVTKKVLILEVAGKMEVHRGKTIYPDQCYELLFKNEIINGYPTLIDIIVCPIFENTEYGMLVVNKSIKGSSKQYGATLYQNIPVLKERIKNYTELPIDQIEKDSIKRFIEETQITSAESINCNKNN